MSDVVIDNVGDIQAGAHEVILEAVKLAVDACYGTDERHHIIAEAAADLVVYNKPIPWSLSKRFGSYKS